MYFSNGCSLSAGFLVFLIAPVGNSHEDNNEQGVDGDAGGHGDEKSK